MRRIALLLGMVAVSSIASCAAIVGFDDNRLGSEDGGGGTGGVSPPITTTTTGPGGEGGGGQGGSVPTAPTLLWKLQLGDDGDDRVSSVTLDGAGNVFVLGDFEGAIDLGGGLIASDGELDVFVAKYDPDGKHLWSKALPLDIGFDLPDPGGYHVAVDGAGDLLLAAAYIGPVNLGGGAMPPTSGNLNAGIAAAKLSGQDGAHTWSRGSGDDLVIDTKYVVATPDGSLVMSGVFNSAVNFGVPIGGDGEGRFFLIKLNNDGDHVFSKAFNGGPTFAEDSIAERAGGLAIDGDGNIIFAGTFQQSINLGDGAVTSKGGPDIFVAKFAPNGTLVWKQTFGGSGFETLYQVAVTKEGEIFMTGEFQGSVNFGGDALNAPGTFADMFLVKLDADGKHLSSTRFESSEGQFPRSIAVDGAGNLLLAGGFFGEFNLAGAVLTSAVDRPQCNLCTGDAFIAKLSPTGAHVWSKTLGALDDQVATGILPDANGNALVVGAFGGTVDFGDGPVTAKGPTDGFVAKYAP